VHFIKCPNAVLDPGTVVASLELDDPNRVTQAQLYLGEFPVLKGPLLKGDKLHQVFQTARENLQHIMTGYAAEEPHFTKFLNKNEHLSSISGRIPEQVEEAIHRLLANYASNITSVLSQFPSQQIANVVDAHAATLTKRADREAFFLSTQSIVQLVQR
ncbi:acetyl- carboxylase 1 isoform X1, partial [Paramuricea clavata]